MQIISEIGIKLGNVLWRKFSPSDREAADDHLIDTGYHLCKDKEYSVAERLMEMGHKFNTHHSEIHRLMMLINYANARRLRGDASGAAAFLKKMDWSATGSNFQICVAAVCEDVPKLCQLMGAHGLQAGITAEDYRDWPVFRGLRRNELFLKTFEEIFKKPLFGEVGVAMGTTVAGDELLSAEAEKPKVVH